MYDTELGTFALSLVELALPVLAAGHNTLVAQFQGNTDLGTLARERGIAAVLNSGHPLVIALEKDSKELATSAEKQAEALMAEAIRRRDSRYRVIGEEGKYGDYDEAASVWVLDPVDGTSRWVRSILAQALGVELDTHGGFAIMVGMTLHGQAQLGLVRELRIADGHLVGGDAWLGEIGRPTTRNGIAVTAPAPPALAAATIACTVHEVMFTTAEQRLDYEILARTAAAVQRDLNALGAMHVLKGTVHAFVEGDLAGTDAIALIPVLVGGGVRVTDHHGRTLPCDTQSVRRSEYRILMCHRQRAQPMLSMATARSSTGRTLADRISEWPSGPCCRSPARRSRTCR